MVGKIQVIFEGKDYIMLYQYASGYCEIVEDGARNGQVKLVHFTELSLKEDKIS
ncbi:hypothetical protein [Bacillus sp. ISL-40]|uniref:hypothetical protein n=1 Tax=Bacillus sp. ISL-40 TaxID=2819126 RepID=UPI001BEC96D2|nr:hypothetical protein [Bacillus sp. ISL-40]